MWEAHRANCFCDITRICHSLVRKRITATTRLEVELDHGRGGARSGAGCPPSERSGAKVHVQPTVLRVELRVIARHAFAVIVPFITGN